MAPMAMTVKIPALIWPTLSPKLSRPTARPPRMMVKLSHDRKVRSLAKKTLGSTRVGRAIRLPDGLVRMIHWSMDVTTYLELFGEVVVTTFWQAGGSVGFSLLS